jgi:tyrosine-protein kinase Etk/Wzc
MANINIQPTDDKEKENLVSSSLIEFLFVAAKWKKFLIIFIILCVLSGTVIAIFSPKEYKATASVLPVEQNDLLSSLGGISSLTKSFSSLKGLSALKGQDETDKYIAILKSATVLNDVIDNYNIKKVYDMQDSPMWKVAKKLQGNLEFNVEDEGNLTINVFDESPKLAADIANHLVELLNGINTKLHITNAKAVREFVEKRYVENMNDIVKLESEMTAFQKKNGILAVPEQLEATFKTISTLYADLAKKEIEYNVIKKTMGSENPIVNQKELEFKEFKEKFKQMTSSSEAKLTTLVPLNQAPELLGKYFNIYKNLEIQYKIAEFITPVYEQAKIEEIKNTPSVLVLDVANPPERKARPKISLYILISFFVSLIFGFFMIFTLEAFDKIKLISPDKYNFIRDSFRLKSRKKNTNKEVS